MDELNATTEGGASLSTTDVVAADAGGANATEGQQTTESSQGQNAAESTPEEFSAGWSFDDEQNAEPEIPETDDDIQELLKDPLLDQSKAPKLVEDLRGARAIAKQFKAENRQLREQIAQLEQYGGVEGAGQTAGLVRGLIHNPVEGAVPFMTTLAKEALPAYQAVADALVEHEHEYLVKALQATGKLPDTQAQTAGQVLTAEDWARIPQELHEVAKQIPAHELIQWLDNGNDATLRTLLETHKRVSDLEGRERQQAEQAWRGAVQQAQQQGYQSVQKLSEQYTKAHFAQFSKWQPYGPENGTQNQQLYSAILEGAFAQLRSDPQWETLRANAVKALEQAPLRRLNGEHMAADADEREAHKAAARYNTRLGQVMKGMIQSLDSVFRDARAYRESQRQQIPERKEISGPSSSASNGHKGSALDENGRLSKSFMDGIKRNLGIGG